MVGVVLEINSLNSRNRKNNNLIIFNQVYSKYIMDDGLIRTEEFDVIDIVREGLQRGER